MSAILPKIPQHGPCEAHQRLYHEMTAEQFIEAYPKGCAWCAFCERDNLRAENATLLAVHRSAVDATHEHDCLAHPVVTAERDKLRGYVVALEERMSNVLRRIEASEAERDRLRAVLAALFETLDHETSATRVAEAVAVARAALAEASPMPAADQTLSPAELERVKASLDKLRGPLPCGHSNRTVCSAAMCDGKRKTGSETIP
jgi:hypothetical protein